LKCAAHTGTPGIQARVFGDKPEYPFASRNINIQSIGVSITYIPKKSRSDLMKSKIKEEIMT